MILVIAEKPSVGAAIGKVLGASSRKDGYLEGNNYIVSWCVGHLVYTVSGIGMETITVTPDGEMTFSGNDAFADIAGSMPCETLGEHGFIRLSIGTAETAHALQK